MAALDPALDALVASLTEDGRSLLRSVRARAGAAGLHEQFEGGRAGRGELLLLHTGVELARLLLKAGALPKIAFAAAANPVVDDSPEEAWEIDGLRDAAAVGDRLRSVADARTAAAPQLDLFGKGR